MATETDRRWVYAGRRVAKGNKLVHAWHDPSSSTDRLFLFNKQLVPGAVVGQEFVVRVQDNGDDGMTVLGTPVYAGPASDSNVDEHVLATWRAEDRAAGVTVEAARRGRRAADDPLEAALDVLRVHYRAARTWDSRAAFAAYVGTQITLPPTKKGS